MELSSEVKPGDVVRDQHFSGYIEKICVLLVESWLVGWQDVSPVIQKLHLQFGR